LLYQLLGGTGVGKLPQLAPRPWLSAARPANLSLPNSLFVGSSRRPEAVSSLSVVGASARARFRPTLE
jgi:hypothetical protein